MHVHLHTRPSVAHFHTYAQKASHFHHRATDASAGSAPLSMSEREKGGGNWMQFCFKQESNNCGFCNWVCF